MKLDQIHNIYFLGIGGIGMSALARYFHTMGKTVSGYDRTETPLTKQLEREGMSVCYHINVDHIPVKVDLVVYTPAIPNSMPMMQYARNLNSPFLKRAEVLGMISKSKKGIAVAGTHGKTSTTALLTHLLKESGIDCTSFMGGIASNFSSNYVYGTSDWVVMEADEFDRSFLHLRPEHAILTSVDADHLDIYEHHESLIEGFNQFIKQVNGSIIISSDCKEETLHHSDQTTYTYGIDEGQIQVSQIRLDKGGFIFNYTGLGFQIDDLFTPFPGRHNIKNACAAISISLSLGCLPESIKKALADFKGVRRRFEFVVHTSEKVYIDDYAHHPTEIEAALDATRQLFPDREITGVFQPHLYSRTRDFMTSFARALEKLDRIILLDIYPAREEPIEGVTSQALLEKIHHSDKNLLDKEGLLSWIENQQTDVLITLGAGDIGQMVQAIKERLN